LDKGLKNIQEYYIIFTASKHNNWMVRMLTAPYQHVYAIKKSRGKQFWIVINPLSPFTDVNIYPVTEYPHVRMLIESNDKVVKVKANIENKERWTLCIINCVEVVKSLLGIRSFWTFTPKQLYKYLGGHDEQLRPR
jgi:hypothetical protein